MLIKIRMTNLLELIFGGDCLKYYFKYSSNTPNKHEAKASSIGSGNLTLLKINRWSALFELQSYGFRLILALSTEFSIYPKKY